MGLGQGLTGWLCQEARLGGPWGTGSSQASHQSSGDGGVSSCLCLREPFYGKYILAGALAAFGIYIINKDKKSSH